MTGVRDAYVLALTRRRDVGYNISMFIKDVIPLIVLLSSQKKQFKANLHCHSTYSDGSLSPMALKTAYKQHGYHILCISDHESPREHTALTDEDFLLLTGYEAYIRPDAGCAYDVFASEIHLNLFARDPYNETLICYNPAYCKYLSAAQQASLAKAGSQRTREYTVDYINEFIQTACENGYLVSYNHPVWSMEEESRILAYEGCFSMEMVNGNSLVHNNMEYNGPLYDALLRHGKRLFVHAADDNHNRFPFGDPQCDSFRAATMILADKLTYDAVFEAMETGEMYSTMGPTFEEITFDGETLHVSCSDVSVITCHIGSKNPACVRAAEGETVNSADFVISPYARYVRFSVMDEKGRRADTRAYFREELGFSSLG